MREPARAVIGRVTSAFHELQPPDADDCGVDGPIGWPGYDDAHAEAERRTGERESVVCGVGKIGDVEAVLVSFEFGFLGGSIGEHTGRCVEQAIDKACEFRMPVVSLIATGGSRMQEGLRALVQLQRIAHASERLRRAGLPHIAVLREPTTGGGWATLGAGADVVLALSGAQVGFAGSRVRPPGAPHAYTAEDQHMAGHVDQIVEPAELPARLERWMRLVTTPSLAPAEPPRALGTATLPDNGWQAVQQARDPQRPRAGSYVDDYFDWHEPVSGDRCGGVDPGMLCGFGQRDGATIAYAAQCGTPTLPAGFRTAARLVRLADRLGIPVLTLVDTPGAANAGASRSGTCDRGSVRGCRWGTGCGDDFGYRRGRLWWCSRVCRAWEHVADTGQLLRGDLARGGRFDLEAHRLRG
jgi:acetyl-CoA carboxylase carboxyl transferase subunit beta